MWQKYYTPSTLEQALHLLADLREEARMGFRLAVTICLLLAAGAGQGAAARPEAWAAPR